eukprot:1124707_1
MHPFAQYPPIKYLCAVIGLFTVMFIGPLMGLTMGVFVLWFIFINDAKETGIIYHPQSRLSTFCANYYSRFVRHKEDVFVGNLVLIQGIVLPLLFFVILYVTRHYELPLVAHLLIWYVYTFARVGPAAQHFAYVHTLAHKEGHSVGIFTFAWYPLRQFVNNAFNWWIGLFYGLMPGTYSYGHSINHHSFNNLEGDLISTGWDVRDNIMNWFAYLVQFALYHLNITSFVKFYVAKKTRRYAKNMIVGMTWYWSFHVIVYIVSGYNATFVFWYLTYPIFEGLIFLSGVNWAWHMFVDPTDHHNEFVGSITLLNGPGNVLHEDYHVVHHQYPAHHWSTHPRLFEKRKTEYYKNNASVFQQTHAMEIFFYGITRQYDKIAQKYDKSFLPKSMTRTQLVDLIKCRVRETFY